MPRQWSIVNVGDGTTCAVTVSHRGVLLGRNDYGQVGDGTTTNRSTPTPVDTSTGLTATNVSEIRTQGFHSCARTTTGSAYCWGQNAHGEVGDNSTTQRLTPTPVSTSTGLAAGTISGLRIGQYSSCARNSSNRIYCWGDNSEGQLGDGTTTQRNTPTLLSAATGVTSTNALRSGYRQACVVTSASQAYCWGRNQEGQIGDNSSGTNRLTPTAVDTTTGVSTNNSVVTPGGYHSCTLTTTSQAYCWGLNDHGQVGDNSSGTNRLTPTPVNTTTGLTTTNVSNLAPGLYHTCARTSGSRMYCWGDNTHGSLGDGTTTQRTTPTAVSTSTGLTTSNVASIAAGSSTSCAITSTGVLYCWGLNDYGQVGDGSTGTDRLTPTAPDTTAIPAAPGTPTGLAGTSWQSGQVPLSWNPVAGATDYQVQYRVNGSGGWTQLGWQTATSLTVGTLADGTTYEFQVQAHNGGGNSAWSASLTAQPDTTPAGVTATSGLDGQVSLSWTGVTGATDYQAQWRTSGSGSWTANGWTGGATTSTVSGLANNTTYEFQVEATTSFGTSPWTASTLGTPRQWAQVSVGYQHSCAVTVSGRAYCWGHNAGGQIGDGTFGVDRLAPVPVDTTTGLTTTNVARISAADDSYDGLSSHTCAITTTGRRTAGAYNAYGQLGDNTSGPAAHPDPREHHHRTDHHERRPDQRAATAGPAR